MTSKIAGLIKQKQTVLQRAEKRKTFKVSSNVYSHGLALAIITALPLPRKWPENSRVNLLSLKGIIFLSLKLESTNVKKIHICKNNKRN